MRVHDLSKRIRLGEDGSLELREVHFRGARIVGPNRQELSDDLAAFANSTGGQLILGVSDDLRRVPGIPPERSRPVEELVRSVCNNSIHPALDAGIFWHELTVSPEGELGGGGSARTILLVDVPRSLVVHRSSGGYFRRVGSSKRQLDPAALHRLMMLKSSIGNVTFDELPVSRTTAQDLDTVLAERFVSGEADFDLAVRKLGLIVRDDGDSERLSVGGVLMCTEAPQQWLRSAYIQAVLYAAEREDEQYQLDARDIDGPLDLQVQGALDFVVRNMRIGAVKRLGRVEVPQYSKRAVFEALVNAVAHRDYSFVESRIRLHMFADRIELSVPGGLVNTLRPDALHLRQASRNPLVVSLLARCPASAGLPRTKLMDQRGDGVPRIRKHTQRLAGRLPEYSLIDDSELRLNIPAATPF